ncbi:hypothetical protein GALMADRAFT_242355 [Galerina marginata CBS 339.88]|uniref:Uncharacterized protein n=1 Tax=Galerina marginata (strain CBS 339.88) TaxID=685588 RepID=A0A067TCN3_GALM3|nr:hypothetical protein GALMADRAFT_242355 [Galerina marginata CBS 339.88]
MTDSQLLTSASSDSEVPVVTVTTTTTVIDENTKILIVKEDLSIESDVEEDENEDVVDEEEDPMPIMDWGGNRRAPIKVTVIGRRDPKNPKLVTKVPKSLDIKPEDVEEEEDTSSETKNTEAAEGSEKSK